MRKLLARKSSGEELSLFQMRSLDVQNMFLKEMVLKNVLSKLNVGVQVVNEIKEIVAVANELAYPDMPQCVWCGENILLITC